MRIRKALYAAIAIFAVSIIFSGFGDLSDASAASPGAVWDGFLDGSHKKVTRQEIQNMARGEGIQKMGPLMRGKYIVRVEIKDTGGGSASHSEVLLKFAGTPRGAMGKAWADQNERNRAEIGNLSDCPTGGYTPEGHRCPTKYNAMGWVDLTSSVNGNNKVLIINDPNAGYRAGTIIWFSFDQAQNRIAYDIIEKTTGNTFGFGKINARKYVIGEAEPPPPPPPPPVTPPGTNWNGYLDGGHQPMNRRAMRDMLIREGISDPRTLLGYPYLVRIEIKNTGGGSASHSEVLLKFTETPKAAIGKAWADQNERNRAEIGNLSSCPTGGYTPEGHRCPTKYNAAGWINLTNSVNKNDKVLIINDPNAGYRAGTIVWFAFSSAQTRIPYDIIEKTTGHTFGFGKISAKKYQVKRAERPTPRPPQPIAVTPPGSKWDGVLGSTPQKVTRKRIMEIVAADGLNVPPGFFSAAEYVRVEISNTGGGRASHSEVLLGFKRPPKAAFGKAWADANDRHRAQIGNLGNCRAGGSYAPEGHTCPKNFNGMGWVNVTNAVKKGTKVLIINDPNAGNRANTIIWFAFKKPGGPIQYDIIEKKTGQTFGFGKISAKRYRIKIGKPR